MTTTFSGPMSSDKQTAAGQNLDLDIRKKGSKGQGPSTEGELRRLVDVLKGRELYPFIVFSFSRRECEAYAKFICSTKRKKGQPSPDPIDLNDEEEKDAVRSIFDAALECLDQDDRCLPCIESMLPMLLRGVGVHHSGLLPILKEIVELLFQENLVKCLFSTETFAMGLNMPAKTVVFTSLTKWDGQMTRPLTSGEYIQMSGRAGRRGKDDKGFAMMLVDDKLTKTDCKEMLKGEASFLQSSFRLSYYTLLNLIRSRSLGRKDDMEYVISKSFQQFQHEQLVPQVENEVKELREEAGKLVTSKSTMESFMKLQQIIKESRNAIKEIITQPKICLHVMRPGRIVRVCSQDVDWGYGVVLSVQRLEDSAPSDRKSYIADVMLSCTAKDKRTIPCPLDSKDSQMLVISVSLHFISELSTLRITLPEDLRDEKSKKMVRSTIKSLLGKYKNGRLPELDPCIDFEIPHDKIEDIKAAVAKEQEAINEVDALKLEVRGGSY